MSICLTWFHINGLGEPNVYHNLGDFTRKWGFYLVVFLVGVRFSGGLLFYSSVPQSYFDGLVKSTLLENVGLIWGSKIIRHP